MRYIQAHPLCVECHRAGLIVAASVVDHCDGHQHADWVGRFWNEDRWQSLCLACHAKKSASELAEWNRSAGGQRPSVT
jgi:5-methylcytosine-specific restriction protein A